MTVERFLRRGVDSSYKKNSEIPLTSVLALSARSLDLPSIDHLQLRSRPVVRSGSPAPESSSGSSSPQLSDSSELKSNTRKRRKPKRPFKKRLYEAAIASGVDPVKNLVQPQDTPSSRVPLTFKPLSPPQPRRSRGTIVTPRGQDNPFRHLRLSRPHDSRPKLPLARFQSFLPDLSQLGCPAATNRNVKQARATTRKDVLGENTVTCSPLLFVPLSQAEDSYAAMFNGRRRE